MQFPESPNKEVSALKSLNDLDYYTFAVAGCVGEFWTQMMCAHLPNLSHWDLAGDGSHWNSVWQGAAVGQYSCEIYPKILRMGRCYIPEPLLQEVGLRPKDLLQKQNYSTFRPILRRLVFMARDHLDQGWQYTMSIPRMEFRLRLACMWPILIGMRTLHLLTESSNLLDSTTSLKVSRQRNLSDHGHDDAIGWMWVGGNDVLGISEETGGVGSLIVSSFK